MLSFSVFSIQYECICQPFLSRRYQHFTVYDKNELSEGHSGFREIRTLTIYIFTGDPGVQAVANKSLPSTHLVHPF